MVVPYERGAEDVQYEKGDFFIAQNWGHLFRKDFYHVKRQEQ